MTKNKKTPEDKILIKGLKLNAFIGIYEFEHKKLQPLIFDLAISATSFAKVGNDLSKSIDYADLVTFIQEFVNSKKHLLLETLAEEVAQLLFKNFAMNKLKLTLFKPEALKTATAGVEITRTKNDYSRN